MANDDSGRETRNLGQENKFLNIMSGQKCLLVYFLSLHSYSYDRLIIHDI